MSWDPALLERLMAGTHMSLAESSDAVRALMQGHWSEPQIAAFLVALRIKGETIEEIAGAARTMRELAGTIEGAQDAVDIVGTGGDGAHSLNISTAAAFVARGAGARVAKHGNRSVSSRSGSADVLEALGARVELTPAQSQAIFEKTGFCFMYAPQHHPSMRNVAPVRKALGIRTIFNLLGPLTNPAHVRYALVGIYDRALVEPYASVLRFLGYKRAIVVHGDPNLDEFSTSGSSFMALLEDNTITTRLVTAAELGCPIGHPEDIAGADAEANARAIRQILSGARHPGRDAVALNAGMALYAAGVSTDITDGYSLAIAAITEGAALQALDSYVAASLAA